MINQMTRQKLVQMSLEQSLEAIFWLDQSGEILYANDQANVLFKSSYDEFRLKRYFDFDLHLSADLWSDFWRKLKQEKQSHFESQLKADDGRVFAAKIRCAYQDLDQNAYAIVWVQDISAYQATELALAESQARLDKMTRDVPGIIYQVQSLPEGDFRFLFVSDWCRQVFGLAPEVLQKSATPLLEMIHPDDAGRFQQAVGESMKTLRPFRWEGRFILADGHITHIQGVGQPELQGDGSLIWSGILLDINSLKSSEAALERRAVELETVLDVSQATANILDIDELLQQVVELTKTRFQLYHTQIYLYDDSEAVLKLAAGAGEIGQSLVREAWQLPISQKGALLTEVARSKKGMIIYDTSQDAHYVSNIHLPDTQSELAVPILLGEELFGVLSVQATQKNRFEEEDIRIYQSLSTQLANAIQNARLFAQSQQALDEVKESQALLQTIIDATPDWIFIKDKSHRYQLVNQGYADSWNMKVSDFIGKNDLEIGFPEEVVKGNPQKGIPGFWQDDKDVMEQRERKIIPVEAGAIAGKPAFLSTIKVPLFQADGKVWGVLGYVRDITKRETILQQAEVQAQRLSKLNEVGTGLTQTLELEDIYRVIVSGISEMFYVDTLGLSLLEDDRVNLLIFNPVDQTIEQKQHFPPFSHSFGANTTRRDKPLSIWFFFKSLFG